MSDEEKKEQEEIEVKPEEQEGEEETQGADEGELEEEWLEKEPEEDKEQEQEKEEEEEKSLSKEEPKLYKIVHNGRVYEVTEDKYLELAQKGFDYDYKVGPHARIAKLIESDPNLANIVNEYVQGKLSGQKEEEKKDLDIEIKSIDQYETADDWLRDNIKCFAEKAVTPVLEQQQTPQQQDPAKQIITLLKVHDPQNFESVYPKMIEQIPELTVSQYQKIDSDIGELFKFYDSVKEKISKENSSTTATTKTPPFRVASGRTEKTIPNKDKPSYVWDLPNAKFEEILRRAKGF